MNICCDPTRGVYPLNIYSAILRRILLSYLGSDNYRVIISTQELATLLDVAQLKMREGAAPVLRAHKILHQQVLRNLILCKFSQIWIDT